MSDHSSSECSLHESCQSSQYRFGRLTEGGNNHKEQDGYLHLHCVFQWCASDSAMMNMSKGPSEKKMMGRCDFLSCLIYKIFHVACSDACHVALRLLVKNCSIPTDAFFYHFIVPKIWVEWTRRNQGSLVMYIIQLIYHRGRYDLLSCLFYEMLARMHAWIEIVSHYYAY